MLRNNSFLLVERNNTKPPKCKYSKEEIINAALEITRKDGYSAVTARAVGAKLNSSPKVIFSWFKNMEELQVEILKSAKSLYEQSISSAMSNGSHPPYKASGMAYIQFAKEEKELFKLLFMRDRSSEENIDNRDDIKSIIEVICKNTGLDENTAFLFHMELWLFVHGIATMIATSYLDWDIDFISKAMTDAYMGLKDYFCKED